MLQCSDVREALRNYTRDEGRAFRGRQSGADLKPPQAVILLGFAFAEFLHSQDQYNLFRHGQRHGNDFPAPAPFAAHAVAYVDAGVHAAVHGLDAADVERIVGAVNKITAGKPNPGVDADAVGPSGGLREPRQESALLFLGTAIETRGFFFGIFLDSSSNR